MVLVGPFQCRIFCVAMSCKFLGVSGTSVTPDSPPGLTACSQQWGITGMAAGGKRHAHGPQHMMYFSTQISEPSLILTPTQQAQICSPNHFQGDKQTLIHGRTLQLKENEL